MTEDDDSDSEGALFGVSTMNMSNNTNNTDVLFGFGSSPTVTKDFSTSGFNKNNINSTVNTTKPNSNTNNFYENLNSGGLFMSAGYQRTDSKREHLNSQLDKHGLFSEDNENLDESGSNSGSGSKSNGQNQNKGKGMDMFKDRDDPNNTNNANKSASKHRRGSSLANGSGPQPIKVSTDIYCTVCSVYMVYGYIPMTVYAVYN